MKRICRIGPLLGVVTTAFATMIPSGTYYRDVLPILERHWPSAEKATAVADWIVSSGAATTWD